jgi:PAS domain-containing protein
VRDAVEAGTISACIGDSSRILEANDTYLDLTGFSREEMEAASCRGCA